MSDDTGTIVAALNAVREEMTSVREELVTVNEDSKSRDEVLRRYGKRSRLFIALDVLLTVVSTVAVAIALSASGQASGASAATRSLCVKSNQSRAQQVVIWNKALEDLGIDRTAKGRAFHARFDKQLHQLYKPRDCKTLGGGK